MNKISAKLRIFAIISSILIVAGMVLGTVFQLTGSGFYNFGGEYAGYKSVTVSYTYTEFGNSDDVEAICEEAFAANGLTAYAKTSAGVSGGNEITYRFTSDTENASLKAAQDAINAKIEEVTAELNGTGDIPTQSEAVWHEEEGLVGGEHVLAMASIALAVIVAVQLIYTVIRYKLTAMCAAFVADLHNLALFAALLAICRVPVTSSVMTFAVLIALVSAVCVTLTLDAFKRNRKDGDFEKLSDAEVSDMSAAQTFKLNVAFTAFLAIVVVLAVVLNVISALTVTALVSPLLGALVAFVVCIYGNTLFVPAIYPCLRKLCGKMTNKPSQKKGK